MLALCLYSALAVSAVSAGIRQEGPVKELDSYMLVMDEAVIRKPEATDYLWFGKDLDLVRAKLKEFGTAFPAGMNFRGETLFLILVTDRIEQAFDDVSGIESERVLIIDMKTRKADDGAASRPGAKASRIFVMACSPVPWAKKFEMRTSDGKRHSLEAQSMDSRP
jgi:hypothetical protein